MMPPGAERLAFLHGTRLQVPLCLQPKQLVLVGASWPRFLCISVGFDGRPCNHVSLRARASLSKMCFQLEFECSGSLQQLSRAGLNSDACSPRGLRSGV